MTRQVFLLDLKDEALAAEYDACHQPGCVPDQVLADIRAAGVEVMEIYRFADRLVMLTESAADADAADRVSSAASQEWEQKMDRLQRPLPGVLPGGKWQEASKIFELSEHENLN